MPVPGSSRRFDSTLLPLVVVVAAVTVWLTVTASSSQDRQSAVATKADVQDLCGSCHRVPPIDALPRDAWKYSIARMALIREGLDAPVRMVGMEAAADSGLPSDMQRVLRFYEQHAPGQLTEPEPWPEPGRGPVRFARRSMSPRHARSNPAVSNVRLLDLDGNGRLEVVVTDMRHGLVLRGRPYEEGETDLELIAEMPHPVYVQAADLAGDGTTDLLIADLGEFYPRDHDKGGIAWLRGLGGGRYAPFDIGGFPRVASVEAGDFTGNGALDLLVAAFGFRHTGHITLLENRTTDYSRPSFVPRQLSDRPGALRVIPVDLNGNGRLDFVAAIAQEHEEVVAFFNEGPGRGFRKEVIFTGPHPSWGLTGIEVVDLDGNGKLDVVMINGDMFDDHLPKPYHGITWLQNRGSFPFTAHRLAALPGVLAVKVADLSGNDRLDIVASVFMPGVDCEEMGVPSLVWLEQVAHGRFERHTLARGPCEHATLDVGDVNADGATGIVVGRFTTEGPVDGWVDVWEDVSEGSDTRTGFREAAAEQNDEPSSPAQ